MSTQTPAHRLFTHLRGITFTQDEPETIAAAVRQAAEDIGAAMQSHLRDIREETESPELASPAEIIIEMYRRTFFDARHAERYGTGHIAGDITIQQGLADYLIGMGTNPGATSTPARAHETLQ